MAKGKNRGGANTTSARSGGAANQRNVLAAKNEASIIDQLRAGRHPCKCQARKHKLVTNCMGCGKIVCEQEGSGPCFFCGTLVCTAEEKEILDRGSKKSAELYEKLMGIPYEGIRGLSLSAIGRDLERATEFRNKLLVADADSERRTKVNDLESDYSSIETDPYLTAEERERIFQRREELKQIKEQKRRQVVINVNLADMSVTEQRGAGARVEGMDPVIQEILDRSDDRRRAMEALGESAVDARWVPKGFVPKYSNDIGTTFRSNVCDYMDADNVAMLNDEMGALEVERRGYAIALPQPFATLVANGKIKYIRWTDDIQLKGPVFVSSFAKAATSQEVQTAVKQYCSDFSAVGLDFSAGSLHGRVFVDDCLSKKEFEQEYGSSRCPGVGDFVLVFTVCEPLRIPIPHIPPADFYQLDKELRNAMTDVFKC